jgi:hypothetical protein
VKWPPFWRQPCSTVTRTVEYQLQLYHNWKPSTFRIATSTNNNTGIAPGLVTFSSLSFGVPDTCLKVFDKVFHVHSQILQEYFPFFRAFLNSPDKARLPPSASGFKHNWATKVDKDGSGWNLVNNDSKVCVQVWMCTTLSVFHKICLTCSHRQNPSIYLALLATAKKKGPTSRSSSMQHTVCHTRLDASMRWLAWLRWPSTSWCFHCCQARYLQSSRDTSIPFN